jgi:predicted acyltransferase
MLNKNNTQTRLLSLDVFRGLTVALMILVNSPGNDNYYPWLGHSSWNGCTLADLVFPSFIFILGVSVAFSLNSVKERNIPLPPILLKILKRTVLLFLIGLALNAFPKHFDLSTFRYFGVLQRIAVCYFVAACLFLTTPTSTQALIMLLLMLGYWLMMTMIPGSFDLTPNGNFAAYIDRHIFSSSHLYGKTFDPEGFLSTFPSIATALLGNLSGAWLLSNRTNQHKLQGITIIGCLSLLIGGLWGGWFPINKSLWTSSFVLWTGGLALLILSVCYWLIEIKKIKQWTRPFELFGMSAILAFVLHVFFLKVQALIVFSYADGTSHSLRFYITDHLFSWASLKNASLLYAFSYMMLWLGVLWIIGLTKSYFKYRRST